ncbi:MAG: polysaccharide biosynthesis C-terminal domain-containing protein [Clostridia bacterium]|nr:polysaccharide biosynthesis C-terminal domain-containing protein [Clostridia bacterium]
MARRLTGNDYVFTIFTKVMAVLIGLIASSYSNRFLGPELKGELGRISSMLSIVAVTANFGLYQPYPYYKRRGEPDVLDKFLRIFLLQFLAYTVIGVVAAAAFGSFALTAVCLLAPVQVLANQLSFMIMVEDVKFKNVIFFAARITNTVITILAFYTMERTIMVSLALIVVGDLITIILSLYRLRRVPNPLRADLRFAARIVPFGFISMLTTLMLTLNYRVDTLMMGYMYGIADAEIGFYTLGVSLSEYGWLIPDAFREVLFSRTAKDDAIGEVTMSMKVNLYLTLFMIAGILLLGRPVIWLLAGAEYLPAYPVTVALIVGIIPMSYFKIIGTLLLAQGKKGVYLGMLTGSVVVNVLCNMALIPLWGKMGAAVASVVSYTAAGALFLGYYLKTYRIPVRDVFLFKPEETARLRGALARMKRMIRG